MLAVALDTFFGGGDFRCGRVGLPVAVPAGDLVIRIGATLQRSCCVSGIKPRLSFTMLLSWYKFSTISASGYAIS